VTRIIRGAPAHRRRSTVGDLPAVRRDPRGSGGRWSGSSGGRPARESVVAAVGFEPLPAAMKSVAVGTRRPVRPPASRSRPSPQRKSTRCPRFAAKPPQRQHVDHFSRERTVHYGRAAVADGWGPPPPDIYGDGRPISRSTQTVSRCPLPQSDRPRPPHERILGPTAHVRDQARDTAPARRTAAVMAPVPQRQRRRPYR